MCSQVPGIPEGEVCTCGEVAAGCACEAFEDDRRSLCQMSDSACSLNEGDHVVQETWLVQEYCSLGPLQVQQPLHLPLCYPIQPTAAPCLCNKRSNMSWPKYGCGCATAQDSVLQVPVRLDSLPWLALVALYSCL